MKIYWITVNPPIDAGILASIGIKIKAARNAPMPQPYSCAWLPWPSPRRIAAALDARLREHEQTALTTAPLDVDGCVIPFTEALEVRRQLLATMVKASDDARREADRRMVLGPIDDPDEA